VVSHHLSINIAPRGAQLREESRSPLQKIVDPAQLTILLLELPDPLGLHPLLASRSSLTTFDASHETTAADVLRRRCVVEE
jgi:hypothetical protein